MYLDPSAVGDGMILTPICSKLLEPEVQATVQPSLENIILNWINLTDANYYWGYLCERNNTTVIARNFSGQVGHST